MKSEGDMRAMFTGQQNGRKVCVFRNRTGGERRWTGIVKSSSEVQWAREREKGKVKREKMWLGL